MVWLRSNRLGKRHVKAQMWPGVLAVRPSFLPTGVAVLLYTCLPPEGQGQGWLCSEPPGLVFSRCSPLQPHLWPVQKSGCHLPCLVTIIIDGLSAEREKTVQ